MKVYYKYSLNIKLNSDDASAPPLNSMSVSEVMLDVDEKDMMKPHEFDLVLLKFWKKSTNGGQSWTHCVMDPVEGKVCLYPDDNLSDEHEKDVVDIVAKSGAVALILAKQPEMTPSLPVFFLPPSDVKSIASGIKSGSRVTLTLGEDPVENNEMPVSPRTEFESNPLEDAHNIDSPLGLSMGQHADKISLKDPHFSDQSLQTNSSINKRKLDVYQYHEKGDIFYERERTKESDILSDSFQRNEFESKRIDVKCHGKTHPRMGTANSHPPENAPNADAPLGLDMERADKVSSEDAHFTDQSNSSSSKRKLDDVDFHNQPSGKASSQASNGDKLAGKSGTAGSTKSGGGLIGAAIKVVKKTFANIVKGESDPTLIDLWKWDGWSKKKNFFSYREAMERLRESIGQEEALMDIVREVTKSLPMESNIIKLVFATHLWVLIEYPGKGYMLLQSIAECIEMMDLSLENNPKHLKKLHSSFKTEHKPHLLLKNFFQKMVQQPCFCNGNRPGLWVNVLYLWNGCGLDSQPFDWCSWRMFRKIVGQTFFREQHEALCKTIAYRKRIETYSLLLQTTATDFRSTVYEIMERYRQPKLFIEPVAAEVIKELIRTAIQSPDNATLLTSELESIFNALVVVNFDFDKHLPEWVNMVTFRMCKNFSLYQSFAVAVPDFLQELMEFHFQFHLCEDLGISQMGPDGNDLVFLLEDPFFCSFLTNKEVSESLLKCTENLCRKNTSFQQKLELLGKLYRFIMVERETGRTTPRCFNFQIFEERLLCILSFAVEFHTSEELLLETFNVALNNGIFCNSHGRVMGGVINRVFRCIDWNELQLQIIKKAIVLPCDHGDGWTFHKSLVCGVERALISRCKSMNEASTVFFGLHSNGSDVKLLEMAVKVFETSFQRWKPKSIADILHLKPADIVQFFSCFQSLGNDRSNLEYRTRLFRCQEHVLMIISTWMSSFESEEISHVDLCAGQSFSAQESWGTISRVTEIYLPSKTCIQLKLDEFESNWRSIDQYLSAPIQWKHSLFQVLSAYHCSDFCNTAQNNLFSNYSSSLKSAPGTSDSVRMKNRQVDNISMSSIREHKSAAAAFRSSYDETMSLCEYFLSNRSLIFEKNAMVNERCNPEELKQSVNFSIKSTKRLFQHNTSLGDISRIVEMLPVDDALFEQDCAALRGCKRLELEQQDINRFLIVTFLCRRIQQIKSFANCCEQFKFNFALSDDKFLILTSVINSTFPHKLDSVTLELGEAGCKKIHCLLCHNDPKGVSSYEEIKSDLQKIQPILQLLERLSSHGEVWNLAREMQWFGEEGRHRFNKLYSNVTNVLLGNTSESYYMSVLDSLAPTVRLISVLGEMQGVKSLASFMQLVEKDSDIQTWLISSPYGDLEQVQSNLSLIRRWFCDGVDEIANVSSIYQAVQCTGTYSILQNDDLENAVMLGLSYKTETENEQMHGKELNAFIEQIGLIQREKQSEAEAVEKFLELHHCISDASSNIIEMHSMGFNKVNIQSFVFMADGRYLVEARRLLKKSVALREECELWLNSIRRSYSASLLFWTEELREIYSILTEKDDPQDLALKLSRLLLHESSEKECEELLNATILTARETQVNAADKSCSWLIRVSKFLEYIYVNMRAHRRQRARQFSGKMVVHTLSCDSELKSATVLLILRHIYKSRLPEEFEVLDGLSYPSFERLSLFLERAKAFTSNVFVIINAEEFCGKHLEIVLTFLSNRENASSGIHFHCIQRECSIIHTAPWVEGRNWGEEALSSPQNQQWVDLIVDNKNMRRVTLLASSSCGTGKTRRIRNEMQKIRESNEDCEVGTIVIHEKSNVGSLARELASKFSNACVEKALHVSFVYVPWFPSEDNSVWLKSINHFFFSLLVLRVVHDPDSCKSFHIGRGKYTIFVETPAQDKAKEGCFLVNTKDWLQKHIPILGICCKSCALTDQFFIDEETRRVCTYLRAYEDKTIDRKFEPGGSKCIVFVLDKSESMEMEVGGGQAALSVATDCALSIFDSHVQCEDMVGVIMFNHEKFTAIPIQEVSSEEQKGYLRSKFDAVRDNPRGSTNMYTALDTVVKEVNNSRRDIETWIVCLTDGQTWDSDISLRQSLKRSSRRVHLIVIGINLDHDYEDQMRLLCKKYCYEPRVDTKGFYLTASANIESINQSFRIVSKSIPVSQTFELDGKLTEEDCRLLIEKYKPIQIANNNMQLLNFWIRFLYRRVKVFDANERFNYNETHEKMGSTLMKTMLSEVERFINNDHNHDYAENSYAQLIYDFSIPDAPEFRLLCTSPNLAPDIYEGLNLPGFSIPTETELQKRETLDKFISQSMNIPLEEGRLSCIDEHGFILTLDFTIKILNIHECIACKLPCILEGETGVSKTALTKMYSILRNSSLSTQAAKLTSDDLISLEEEFRSMGYRTGAEQSAYLRLRGALLASDQLDLSKNLCGLIEKKCAQRSALFEKLPGRNHNAKTSTMDMLEWFNSTKLVPTFFEINVDGSLGESDLLRYFKPIRKTARLLMKFEALVVVFLDEINTSSIMGLFKEIVIDRSLKGEQLEKNIVIIAACNPHRSNASFIMSNSREKDLGRDWASGHYQVGAIPPSMAQLKWSFGSLNRMQEKDFIFRRLEMLDHKNTTPGLHIALTEAIFASQEAMRQLAERNISEALRRRELSSDLAMNVDFEASLRAKSVVSLRDIQRVFSLFDFFSHDFSAIKEWGSSCISKKRHAMLLSISVVYYLRLDAKSREDFLDILKGLKAWHHQKYQLDEVLNTAMDAVVNDTILPRGIAITRGLKENIFMTLVCSLSRTPLMIVGPPGSSKTLSVNVVGDNANGEDSPSPFFRQFARLSIFHYQCSKESTSKEITTVFEKASQRQTKVDSEKHRCVVVMDEAGLPEEERESLKALHYLLEGHMSMKAKVGFVAITNHVLDAAKVNRCVMLLRQEPDSDEMLTIIQGVLFRFQDEELSFASKVEVGGMLFSVDSFAKHLSAAYVSLLQLRGDGEYGTFDTFFGLRDFIFFLKAVRSASTVDPLKLSISTPQLLRAIERNFNGVSFQDLEKIVKCFLEKLTSDNALESMRHPFLVIKEALAPQEIVSDLASRARFKLIIDCSEDDSAMRLLNMTKLLNMPKKSLFKLSNMPEEVLFEKMRLISGVKFAALQGNVALLSQTEAVNESFYDLFNQNFRTVTGRDGQVLLYANIAVGGISRRSLVRPQFECIILVRKSQLHEIPAPFLNRFEKFRLDINDVLSYGWSAMKGVASVMEKARLQTRKLIALLGEGSLFGAVGNEEKTLDSVFVHLLPDWALSSSQEEPIAIRFKPFENFQTCLAKILNNITSSCISFETSIEAIEIAIGYLPDEDSETLQQMINDGKIDMNECVGKTMTSLFLNNRSKPLDRICDKILQMAVTRYATSRLLQMATPETVFANRHLLPTPILDEYFHQEHFSLKRLLAQLAQNSQNLSSTDLILSYTRTDAYIHGIPTLSYKQDTIEDEMRKRIKDLVSDKEGELIIEHLELLRSEAVVRSAVSSWVQHKEKKVFILLCDMSSSQATDRINYVRMHVEQAVAGILGKTFLLLLHYPPSSALCKSCYPALFLGGWRHIFLDGIGQLGPSLGIGQWIEGVCKNSKLKQNNLGAVSQLSNMLVEHLPRVLSHVASQRVLYPNQVRNVRFSSYDEHEDESFSFRQNFLRVTMETIVGDATVGKILCSKFAALWLKYALENTMNKASSGLIHGTTQMSMSLSLHSQLVETFGIYIALCLVEINQWRNLDILSPEHRNGEVEILFGSILQNLPIIPFEELRIRSESSITLRSIPLGVAETDGRLSVRFPFFFFLSSSIDEILESVEEQILKNFDGCLDGITPSTATTPAELFRRATALLLGMKPQKERDHAAPELSCREYLVQLVVKIVQSSNNGREDSLFKRYLHQFVEWKIGCSANHFLLHWMKNAAAEFGGYQNILSIHCIARCRCREFKMIASWHVTEQLATFLENSSGKEANEVFEETCSLGSPSSFFLNLLRRFERTIVITAFHDKSGAMHWSRAFSIYLKHICAVESSFFLDNVDAINRLRVVCVFHFLIIMPATPQVQRKTLDHWYNKDRCEIKLGEQKPSLRNLFSTIIGDKSLEEMMLRHFFSMSWVSKMKEIYFEDFLFLIELIEEGNVTGRLAISLLRRACRYFAVDGDSQKSVILGLSMSSLIHINQRLTCEGISIFSDEGTRKEIPHFIPSWLRLSPMGLKSSLERSMQTAEKLPFFNNYNHRFSGRLTEVTFNMMLELLLNEAENITSTDLLMLLINGIEAEMEATQNGQSDMRANDCLVGSAIGALIADARVICYVAKVAYELAEYGEAQALSGTYSKIGHSILEQVMLLQGVRFQDFFFSCIIRLRGEGTLAFLLGENGPLYNLAWCYLLSRGMASNQQTTSLKKAEDALAEAMKEEERKVQEFRLCPSCGNNFSIDERNCGQFVCGRDAHLVNNRPVVGGHPVKDIYGCGKKFSVDSARPYVLDEGVLQPFREAVEREKAKVEECSIGANKLNSAKTMKTPKMLFSLKGGKSCKRIVPDAAISVTNTPDTLLLRILIDGVSFIDCVPLLPDLIEFYEWVHSTFKYLVSKDSALDLIMGEVMKKERLRQRFDPNQVKHLIALWTRLVKGVNSYIRSANFEVMWECEKLEIPFKKIEEAPLIAILSEGSHPTDGYDFLFIIINEIINRYNSFVMRFKELPFLNELSDEKGNKKPKLKPSGVHPRLIMSGNGGAIVVSSLPLLSQSDLETLLEGCWEADKNEFNLEYLKRVLLEATCLQRLSLNEILNPLDCLREKFHFYDNAAPIQSSLKSEESICRSPNGSLYYARAQDLNIANKTRSLLEGFGLTKGDPEIRRTLEINFHIVDSHSTVVKLLEGIRNLLELLKMEREVNLDAMDTGICKGMKVSMECFSEDTLSILNNLGFPELSASQTRLMLSLNGLQLVEFFKYLEYQLASEGYMYAGLPLCMTDPLGIEEQELMSAGIKNLNEDNQLQKLLKLLDDFVRDVLVFYEKQIRDEAISRTCPLKVFLHDSNFCDDSDPIFALLPGEITIRNYISLRQVLYQVRLSLFYDLMNNNQKEGIPVSQNFSAAIQENNCWIWDEHDKVTVDNGIIRNNSVFTDTCKPFWFEIDTEASPMVESDEASHVSMQAEIDDSAEMVLDRDEVTEMKTKEDHAAYVIQKWWRKNASKCVEVDIEDDDESDEDISLLYGTKNDSYFHDIDNEALPSTSHNSDGVSRPVQANDEDVPPPPVH